MDDTGNTTLPTLDAPLAAVSASALRLVPALFLAWSRHQPERAGEVAVFDPDAPGPRVVGREDAGDPARVHFVQLRPGETIDGGLLTGRNVSRQQFRVTPDGDALRVRHVGKARALVDGAEMPRDVDVLLPPGAVLEVPGNCVLLTGRAPPSLPPPPAELSPLHPFGGGDRAGMVGESWRAQQLREDILAAARSGSHVLVRGPTGTGKERVARAVHDLSARARGPYVAANSASFTAELAALELFGNPRGYPNPGTLERPGYFGTARGGTLLLDEIGEVLHAVQAPLLRALDGAYNRVGDPVPRPTGCVVILATNRDAASIKHDVFHRIGVTVETPALAERREDVPLLVRALLLRKVDTDPGFARALRVEVTGGRRDVAVDGSLIAGLLRHPLAGNVRELDNLLLMAIAATPEGALLRWPSRVTLPPPTARAAPVEPPPPDVDDLVEGIRASPEPDRARLHEALDRHRWHFERTAEALGMTVDKLYRLRVKYGLNQRQ